MTNIYKSISALLLASLPGCAAIVFNDLTNNGTIPSSISSFGGDQVQGSNFGGPSHVSAITAAQFTPNQNYSLTKVDIAIGNNGGPGDSNVTIEFFTDSLGLPGSQIGGLSWSFVAASGTFTNVSQVAVSGITVSAGTPYWLVVLPGDANTTTLWAINSLSPSFQGPHAIETPPLSGWSLQNAPGNFFDPAFAIEGDVIPTPEPATLGMIGAGILVAGLRRRRAFVYGC